MRHSRLPAVWIAERSCGDCAGCPGVDGRQAAGVAAGGAGAGRAPWGSRPTRWVIDSDGTTTRDQRAYEDLRFGTTSAPVVGASSRMRASERAHASSAVRFS